MARTHRERVGKAMDLLQAGLGPFVEREVHERVNRGILQMQTIRRFADDPNLSGKRITEWDAAAILRLMARTWRDVFRSTLGPAERSLVQELGTWRNRWAHQERISTDDAYRALDSCHRLLSAVSAPEAEVAEQMKSELLAQKIDQQLRDAKKQAGGSLVKAAADGLLKPWREVVTPHPDVASGQYQQAEFAADLWQVHMGRGVPEYLDPKEFFRRTYLTRSLNQLLVDAVRRLSGNGGAPVVRLQTNFGGGKTHSMLALYHLFSSTPPRETDEVAMIMTEAGVHDLPRARRVVLVGNRISPGRPVVKEDGTVVRTLWGELAYQLGGRAAFDNVRDDDMRSTSPADMLGKLFADYGPVLVLIDEWVAYARQLHDQGDLPGGSFETQFTFAQTLTESAKAAGNCLLVVSLPASSSTGSGTSDPTADDAEVGGIMGREAMNRLANVVGRVGATWRPATADESFEIVRRRLFEPISSPKAQKIRDVTARAFADLYRGAENDFPQECLAGDYELRIRAAYPVHPEVFDRLYTDWSALVNFQRTRGVLRLLASVVHSLWESGDRNPIILPSTVPIDSQRVKEELTQYLSDAWIPVIEKDVDGPGSLPLQIEAEAPALAKISAARRVARTLYMGSAPTVAAANRGIDIRRVKLGCVMPGEPPATFRDALRRMAAAATYLYQDETRYWYGTQPTVTKIAEERRAQFAREPEWAYPVLEDRLRRIASDTAGFSSVHALPMSGADVPDEASGRLVLLSVDHPHTKGAGNSATDSPAIAFAKQVLEDRGTGPRRYRNTLSFLAADKTRVQDLMAAVFEYLAWKWVNDKADELNLDRRQTHLAKAQLKSSDETVTLRIPEAYVWLLLPVQEDPKASVVWQESRLYSTHGIIQRAHKRVRDDDTLIPRIAPSMIRWHMDKTPLWRGNHVSVSQLIEDFASYLYLPRLEGPHVLTRAIRDGLHLLTWQSDSFAYADSWDEDADRYRGLRVAESVEVTENDPGLLVNPAVAAKQLEDAPGISSPLTKVAGGSPADGADGLWDSHGDLSVGGPDEPTRALKPKRFHGAVELMPETVGRDAARVGEEVVAHLSGLADARVRVTLEIEVDCPSGAPDHVVRTVTENSITLKFLSHGFEKE